MTNKEVSINQIEKLDDTALENISGGTETSDKISTLLEASTMYISPLAAVGALGCTIAGMIYHSKASAAEKNKNIEEEEKYNKTAKKLGISAASLTGFLALNSVALSTYYHISD
ncbi:MAG: hypothetical protein Q4D57_05145 [Clostridia bacterium]|nr:hypothetical protein [Clostridia bacterium]